MKRAQILALLLAVAAGIGAMFLMKPGGQPAAQPDVVTLPAERMPTTDVLVTAADVPMWHTLTRADLRWQPWPSDAVPDGAITRAEGDEALAEVAGMMTGTQFARGEPVRHERLMQPDADAGLMSAVLPPGKRALAIQIDTLGTSSAGGFIHPNDRVDVIRIYRDAEESAEDNDVFRSETLLTNVRVLAVGGNVRTDPKGESTVHGETATVELTPEQAEMLSLAQRTGHLILSLRSFADANEHAAPEPVARAVTVVAGGSGGFSTARHTVARRDPVGRDGEPELYDGLMRSSPSEVASIHRIGEPGR